jgi:septal ring factor EnvC (AmiA/AmiB activator)
MAPCSSTSAYPRSSRPCRERAVHALLLGALLLLLPLGLWAQKSKDLEKRRDALDKQIKATTALIDQARKERRNTEHQLHLLNAQIRQREELIRAMNGELHQVDRQIMETEAVIAGLQEDLDRLKDEYARMVRFAYLHRNASDRLSYLFASGSFAQAYRRSRYLGQLAEHRQRQAALIQGTQASLNERIAELRGLRTEKNDLLTAQVGERERLTADKDDHQQSLSTLKKEEGRLKDTLRKQNKKKSDLEAAIRKAISDEIRKSNPVKPKGGSSATAGGTAAKPALTLTPEARELGADFEKNKGKLPWPVEKGTITSRFGRQPHPVLRGIEINNNGIDIACEKGAPVRAVFRGEVSSIIVIPGAGKAVVVNHGAYRTVYSNLRDATVTKGQKVDTKQQVGVVMTDEEGSTAHIEVWRITAEGDMITVDPALWIYRN